MSLRGLQSPERTANAGVKRQRPLPCWCGAYWFPHRIGGGACFHNPKVLYAAQLLLKRESASYDTWLTVMADLAYDLSQPSSDPCPF